MPLYLKALYHPDYAGDTGTEVFDIKDNTYQDKNTSYLFAQNYFFDRYIRPSGLFNTRTQASALHSSRGISYNFLYIPFNYQDGISSIDADFNNSTTDLSSVITSSQYVNELDPLTYQNLANPDAASYRINSSETTVIVVNKFYCNFRNVFYSHYDIDSSTILQNDSIYINFSFAKMISIKIGFGTGNSTASASFLIKSEKTYDYLEDFSDKIFYSNSAYYTDAAFTKLANLKVRQEFFPFLLLNNDSEEIRGKVTSNLKNLDDLNLVDLGEDLSGNDYVDITPVDPPIINQNIITCSINSAGYADVVYNGLPYSYEDTQICGEQSPVVNGNPIAIIRRDSQSNLTLYDSFTALTSETVTVYANNFQYIKYVTLVNNSIVYTDFKDNGSIATSTVKFLSEVLNLNNYYSIEEDGDGYISGITFRFVVYKTSVTETGALFYNLTIPVSIPTPQIISASYNADKTKLELISNYAKTIEYYLAKENSNLQTVSVINIDGLNQRTSVDIDVSSKSIRANAYGFFYDFNGGTRAPYKSEDFNQSIDFDIKIQSLALQIKSVSPPAFKTFYDSAGTAITNLVKAPCLIGSFDNYRMYINYTDTYDIRFAFVFTLATGSKSLFFEIGEGSNRDQLTSLYGVDIPKNDLFARTSIDGKINLTVWLDNKIPFRIPFQFLNFSTNAPEVTSVSAPTIAGASKISASFSFNYKYADLVTYSILDQANNIVYGPITLPRKSYSELYDIFSSGSTVTKSTTTNLFDIQPSVTSLKVEVSAANLKSTYPFDTQSVSLQSSSTSLPQQLNSQTPAEVKFYSDQGMGPGTEVTYVSRGVTYYAFLQLKDVNGADILPANYGNYISTNPSPEFKAVESEDLNLDLDGVSVTKINDYLYSFKISPSSPFNDSAFILDITYSPIIGIPTRDDRIGSVTNS